MCAENAHDNHHAKTVTTNLCREKWLEYPAERIALDTCSRVGNAYMDIFIIRLCSDVYAPALAHGLHGIFHQIEENLLKLVAVTADDGQVLAYADSHADIEILALGFHQGEHLGDNAQKLYVLQVRMTGADGFKKMADYVIKALDFGGTDTDGFSDTLRVRAGLYLLKAAAD